MVGGWHHPSIDRGSDQGGTEADNRLPLSFLLDRALPS
jgi:hypothetical protein